MNSNLIKNRHIRVFISSTFRDMQDERDYLMKRTFPKLRKLAAERDVTLTELDLRWGITEEDAKKGRVVEICLREIENSVPFFVGIIGNRYGWIPDKSDIGENVIEHFKEVDTYLHNHFSVTEMEIQFGVLQRKENMHAFFYIKDYFEEQDNPEMLRRLKQEVIASKYPSLTYKSTQDLAEKVEDAFKILLNELFPEAKISEHEKELIKQRSFMNQLCQNYIRNDEIFTFINEWSVHDESRKLIITGESGLGKSSLIANWVNEKLLDEYIDYNIIYHFVGNGGSECSHAAIIKYLQNEIERLYQITTTEEDQNKILYDLFEKIATSQDKPLLIVIDAINQLFNCDNAKALYWLPPGNEKIKMLLSTTDDDKNHHLILQEKMLNYNLLPLDQKGREDLINSYLNLYSKQLTSSQVTRIALNSKCQNTLVLKTILDGLISFGHYELLDDQIDYYLNSETIEEFYQYYLQDLEKEYGQEAITSFLTLISMTRNGIEEFEILKISGLPSIVWSEVYPIILPMLTTGKGIIQFAHIKIREAVVQKYLNPNNKYLLKFRQNLLEILKNNGDDNYRTQAEIAFQLYQLGRNKELYDYITDDRNVIYPIIINDETCACNYFLSITNNNICSYDEFIKKCFNNKIGSDGFRKTVISTTLFDLLFGSSMIKSINFETMLELINCVKSYLSFEYRYPSCIYKLAENYECLDIEKSILIYRIVADFYNEHILLPPPGFTIPEEIGDIYRHIQELQRNIIIGGEAENEVEIMSSANSKKKMSYEKKHKHKVYKKQKKHKS